MILLEKYKLENYDFIRKTLSISKKIQVNWRYLNIDSTELVYKLKNWFFSYRWDIFTISWNYKYSVESNWVIMCWDSTFSW